MTPPLEFDQLNVHVASDLDLSLSHPSSGMKSVMNLGTGRKYFIHEDRIRLVVGHITTCVPVKPGLCKRYMHTQKKGPS